MTMIGYDTIRVVRVTQRFFPFFKSYATFEKKKGSDIMRQSGKRLLLTGTLLLTAFVIWTILIQVIDVRPIGPEGTSVGFAALNSRFHALTGVHMTLYTVTDWLGLVPIAVCTVFGVLGFVQMVKRKSLLKVDFDIIILGVYYIAVIIGYLVFEMIPINCRPILIDGFLEASYPSSTTLLVLSVMPTLCFQADRRLNNGVIKRVVIAASILFSLFMVIGRTVAGVHWLTDIIGSVLLSAGLFLIYTATIVLHDHRAKP